MIKYNQHVPHLFVMKTFKSCSWSEEEFLQRPVRTEHKQIPENSWHRPLPWLISFIVFAFILSRPRYPHAPTIVPLRRWNNTKTPRDASAYTEPRQKGLPGRPCPTCRDLPEGPVSWPTVRTWNGYTVLRTFSDLTQSPLGLLGTNSESVNQFLF